MRIAISPLDFGGETATHFSAENHRIARCNVVSSLCFWSEAGRKLSERDALLTNAQYLAWCETDPTSDDDHYITLAHAETLGLGVLGTPATVAPASWRVSRDTIWNRVKGYIGQEAALSFLSALPESVRLEFLANEWFMSNNAQVRSLLATLPTYDVTEQDPAFPEDPTKLITSIRSVDADAVLAPDPYMG